MPNTNILSFYISLFFLVLSFMLVIYSTLYRKETIEIRNQLGIALSREVEALLTINIFLALLFTLIIAAVIIFLSSLVPR